MKCYNQGCIYRYVGSLGVECEVPAYCHNLVPVDKTRMRPDTSAVEHPSHYQGPHECIDLMQALFGKEDVMAFCRCNSFKYRFRAGKKEGADAEEDLKKAEWYEDFLIEMRQREGL